MEREMMKATELGMSEVVENSKVSISLDGWSAATAILGICVSVVVVCALNYKAGKM